MSIIYVRFGNVPFAAGSAAPARAPLLERILARAQPRAPISDWRSDAYRLIAPQGAPMPGVAAAALYRACGPVEGQSTYLATPVRCVAGLNNVQLPGDGLIEITPAESSGLAAEFNRTFGREDLHLLAAPSGALFCLFAAETAATTFDPCDVLGRDVGDFLPSGSAGARLRAIMSEVEMWLFEHPVNRARAAAGLACPTGLWLWGGGRVLADLPALGAWTAGDDPLFGAWPPRARFPSAGGAGVLVLSDAPGTDAWLRAESEWFAPALAALRAGGIRSLELCAGNSRFSLNARTSLRLWRRTRPWWEALA